MNQTAQETLVFTRRDATLNRVHQYIRAGVVRRSEWVVLGFLVYAIALGAVLSVEPSVRRSLTLLNVSILAAYTLLIVVDQANPKFVFRAARDAASLALIVLAYREMGWLAQPHVNHNLEIGWVTWDRTVLRGGLKTAIELMGPIIPSILEISYALVYALAPFAVVMLYLHKHRENVDQFLFVFSVAVLLCYAQFPFWPSDPPRVVFLGEDLPSYPTLFRGFNLWMLGNYGIRTSVFPSAHVAGAFAAAFGAVRALPERRWVGRFLLALASLIAIATVYGRYHYLADAVAGLIVAVFAFVITAQDPRRSHGETRHFLWNSADTAGPTR